MTRRNALRLIASGAAAVPFLRGQAARDRHVLLISIDGLAAYALQDKAIPLPTLRRLAKLGSVAEASEVVNPAVTWPNHTSLVTGVTPDRHQVLFNGLPVRGKAGEPLRVEPWVDKPELVKAPTVYDLAHAAGLVTAEVNWVAIHNAPTIHWAFPERPRLTDPVVKEMMAAGLLTEAEVAGFAKAGILWRDDVWTEAGRHILEKHKPNLLLFHLLTTDSSQHRYGARSLGGNVALAHADTQVRRLLDAVDNLGIGSRTTVIVVSDHGFKTYTQVIHANAFLRQKGLVRDTAGSGVACDAWVIPEGGSAMVYVTRAERKAELAASLRTELASIRGVRAVFAAEDFPPLGLPLPSSSDRMADLVLTAEEGYAFDGAHRGEVVTRVAEGATPGAHGYINSDPDMDSVFLAAGAGIRRGARLGRVRNLDVAPTIARLLGLEMKNVQGRVLEELLA